MIDTYRSLTKDELTDELRQLTYDFIHTKGMLANAQTQCGFLTSANAKLQDRLDTALKINLVLIEQRRAS